MEYIKSCIQNPTVGLTLLLVVGTAVILLWVVKMSSIGATRVSKKPLPNIKNSKAVCYVWLSPMNPENRNHSEGSSFGHVALELLKQEYDNAARIHKHIPGSYIENTYISLGPADYPPNLENSLERLRPKLIENYKDDLVYEQRSPDLTFYFHSLDVDSMITKVKSIKESKMEYGLLGAITFGHQTDSSFKRILSWIEILIAIFINKWLLFIPIFKAFCFRVLHCPSKCKSYSCVSIVFEIFHAGMGVSRLLGFSDEVSSALFTCKEASKASSESSKEEELKKGLIKLFKSFGYLTEASISPIIISPDIFADFMKRAKCNEIKFYEISSDKKEFEENIEINSVTHHFKTEEWLPSSNIESRIFERYFVLGMFTIICLTCVIVLLSMIIK